MIDVKKIADEIAEKCGVEEVYVDLTTCALFQYDGSTTKLYMTIGSSSGMSSDECEPIHDSARKSAHKMADEWLESKKHEGGQQ